MNLLEELIKATGLTPYTFAKELEKHYQQVYNNIKTGGDMKFSTLCEYAFHFNIEKLDFVYNGSDVTINFKKK